MRNAMIAKIKTLKAHIVDDLRGHPDTGERSRLHNSTQLGHGSEVGRSLLNSCSRCIGLRRSLSVNVGLRLRLSGSEGVFEGLGIVDDLSGHPDIGCWHNFS